MRKDACLSRIREKYTEKSEWARKAVVGKSQRKATKVVLELLSQSLGCMEPAIGDTFCSSFFMTTARNLL